MQRQRTRLLRVLFLHIFFQPVALDSKPSVVYQEIKITKDLRMYPAFSGVSTSDCVLPSFVRMVVTKIVCYFFYYVFCVSSLAY
jgi:hypothetical protein